MSPNDPLHRLTAAALAAKLETGELTASALMEHFIARTERFNSALNAFNSTDKDKAREAAAASDKRRKSGQALSTLDGIPIAFKDNIASAGEPQTCSSKILEHYISPYDATVTKHLKNAGLILWGRTNLDEFAMGSSTENSAFHTTKNPWNTECTPGGSSGGSSAAVAAGLAPYALGSDTGGSIRQPAAYCGLVGLKPTYGRVSRYGLAAFASSLDQIGSFARSIEDTALLLEFLAGVDTRDSTSNASPVPRYREQIEQSAPWKIGVPKEFFNKEGLTDTVRQHLQKAIDYYQTHGCQIVEISLENAKHAIPVYYTLAPAEASSNLARYDGVRYTHRTKNPEDLMELYCKSRAEGFGSEVKRRIILGTFVLSSGFYDAYYSKAQKVRRLIQNDFLSAFKQVDAILAPTTPGTAFKMGEKSGDPLMMYMEDIFTIPMSLAGVPAVSIPCGFDSQNKPIGMQIIGKPFEEGQMLAIANLFERGHTYHKAFPEQFK